LAFHSTDWFALAHKSSKIVLIDIDNTPKIKDLKKTLTKEQDNFLISSNITKVICFANQGAFYTEDDLEFIKKEKSQVICLEKQVRRTKSVPTIGSRTQAGAYFNKILTENEQESDLIILSINLASLNSFDAPGVCSSSTIGLSVQEIVEISQIAAKSPKLKMLCLTELNPAVENKKTSQIATDIFYNYCKSICEKRSG